MKTTRYQALIILAIVFSSANLLAQNTSLEVTVKNIKVIKGTIRVGLFDKETEFLKTPLKGIVVKVSGTEVKVTFEDLPAGEYAVSIIHDENENGDLDSNAFGIPKEGFAFGNNAMGTFGPPSFDKAKIKLEGKPVQQVITLKYM
jgi:uncharacterized protein (DUF2141 family)